MAVEGGEHGAGDDETVDGGTVDSEEVDREMANAGTVDRETVDDAVGGGAASAALSQLAALRRDAAAAFAAISDADAALNALAGQRVEGERILRHALARHQVASRALAAHERAKPGRLVHLLSGFRAGREWLARQADLNSDVREATGPLTAARRTVSGVKREFAAQVHTRAEAVTALRRLTAECVTVLAKIRLEETGPAETGPRETGFAEVGDGVSAGANTPGANQGFNQRSRPA